MLTCRWPNLAVQDARLNGVRSRKPQEAARDPEGAAFDPNGLRDMNWLAAAKVTPPQPSTVLVDRPAARAALDRGLNLRLTLVIAPAGFGKTTLLGQWRADLAARGLMAAWLSPDEDEGDPLQLLALMTLALTVAGARMGDVEKMASQAFADVPPVAALGSFLSAVARDGRPMVVILDDYQRVGSRAADSMVAQILARCPDNLHLVLSSRERPELPLAGFKAQGQVQELGVEHLRFTPDDARELFAGKLDMDATHELVSRTEGWGVALQLARLWLDGAGASVDLNASFSGRSADLADYLAEQVFNDLPPDAQQVLLETAVCERINGDLANALTGRSDCWDILGRLHRLNALLLPLDDERRWLRCHLLFREFLLETLSRRNGARIPELHLAASRWFEEQGFPLEAVRHARMSGDYARVAGLVARLGGWELVLHGGIGVLRSVLRGLPMDAFRRHPTLRIARAYLHIKDGELPEARAVFHCGDEPVELAPGEDPYRVQRDLVVIGGIIDGYEDRWVGRADLERLRAIRDQIDPADHLGLGCYWQIICVAALRIGDCAVVEEAAVNAVREMRAAGSILGLNYAYFHLGQVQIVTGRLREAEATLREALLTAEENFGTDSGQKAIAEVLLAGVLYMTGDVKGAARHLSASLAHVEAHDSWFDILASGYEAAMAVALLREGPAGALDQLERGVETARRRGLSSLRPLIQALRVILHLRAGQPDHAAVAARDPDFQFTPGAWRDDPGVWRIHHLSGLARAGLHVVDGQPGEALVVLDDLRQAAEAGGRALHLAEIAIAEALVYRLMGRHDAALDRLGDALVVGMGQGAVRLFLDHGQAMEGLLRQALRRERQERVDSLMKTQIARLLEELRHERVWTRSLGGAEHGMSARELEVLAELAHGYSNKEIARALDMTENTVKFHLKNIYAKLGVDKRGAAVARARELMLI